MEEPIETTKDKEETFTEPKKEKTNEQLEEEIQRLRDEFNNQRAKMKELYINKEAECQKLKKELHEFTESLQHTGVSIDAEKLIQDLGDQNKRAQDEIKTLQIIVDETINESINSRNQVKNLGDENEKLKRENNQLREMISAQENASFAPVLTQVKKTILGKLGSSDTNENLEESMRKVNKYAQEDAEVLRSLVEPLEDEIKHLKDKLRDAHEQLEKQSVCQNPPESAIVGMLRENTSASQNLDVSAGMKKSTSFVCEMCQNYETKLVQCQEEAIKATNSNSELNKQLIDLKKELEKEIALRNDLDKQWQVKREQHKEKVESLTGQVKKTEDLFHQLIKTYNEMKENTNRELLKLTADREQVDHHLEILQKDNEFLSGRYISHSQTLKDEEINLPQSVDELHELVLKLHEELIICKSECEHAEAKYLTSEDEINLLRDAAKQRDLAWQVEEKKFKNHIQSLEEHLKKQEDFQKQLLQDRSELERKELEYKKQISESQMQIIELQKFEKSSNEFRAKVSILQQDLATTEAVQKDFVKLSQSLQMQLEKLRSENTQVRWQDEDEVDNCDQCKRDFTVTRRKHHCRHCGTIFCDSCLQKTVPSRSGRKTVKVCDVCYTLLVSTSAPYFSQEPPQSP